MGRDPPARADATILREGRGYVNKGLKHKGLEKPDPFGGAKPRFLRRGKEAPLKVNPEQAQAFGSASLRQAQVLSPSKGSPSRAKSRDRPGRRKVGVEGLTFSDESIRVI
jgi:hypothetical protein